MKYYLLLLFFLFSNVAFSQISFSTLSISQLEAEKSKAALAENYELAANCKKALAYKKQMKIAAEDEDYAEAARLKKALLRLENGEPESSSSSSNHDAASSDNSHLPTIDFVNTVHIWDKSSNSIKNLEFATPEITTKAGGFAFYASATSYYKMSGASSTVKLTGNESFIVKVAAGTNPDEIIKFILFDVMGAEVKDRYLPSFSTSVSASPFSASSSTAQNKTNYRDVQFKKLGNDCYELIFEGFLPPGEYTFFFANKMYAFSNPSLFSNSGKKITPTSYELRDIYKEPVISWYGMDFSLLRYVSGRDIGQESKLMTRFPDWTKQFKSKVKMSSIEAWLRKESLNDESGVTDNLYKTHLTSDWISTQPQSLNLETIQQHLVHYPAGEGIGLVFIPENFNKDKNKLSGYFVWFDMNSKGIIDVYYANAPGESESKWGAACETPSKLFIDKKYKFVWRSFN